MYNWVKVGPVDQLEDRKVRNLESVRYNILHQEAAGSSPAWSITSVLAILTRPELFLKSEKFNIWIRNKLSNI